MHYHQYVLLLHIIELLMNLLLQEYTNYNNNNIFIKPHNSSNFLVLSNGVEFLVSFSGNQCTYPISITNTKINMHWNKW